MTSTTDKALHERFIDTPVTQEDENEYVLFLKDRDGNTLKVQNIDGVYHHAVYKPEMIRQIPDIRLRSDDIYLPAYPRSARQKYQHRRRMSGGIINDFHAPHTFPQAGTSQLRGTHWTFEMTSMLLNGKAETIRKYKGTQQVEFTDSDTLSALPSPRVICAHQTLSDSPTDLVKKKCKVIYPVRDPKDVAVSLYCVYRDWGFYKDNKSSFKGFLYLMLEGKVDMNGPLEHLKDADNFFRKYPDIPVLFTFYEDTSQDPLKTVHEISDFLGLPRDEYLCNAIAEKCSFRKMEVDKYPYSRLVNGKSILFRKGIVGDWRNWFTDEMLEDYYTVYEKKLTGTQFYSRYARDAY